MPGGAGAGRVWAIVAGGALSHEDALRALAAGGAFLCGVDAGLDHALRLGLTPDLALGDFDSVSPGALARIREWGVPVERHPTAKDATDGELALQRALAERARAVHLFAAAGDRLDQTLATALLLPRFERSGLPVFGYAPGWRFRALVPAGRAATAWRVPARQGATISLIPLDRRCRGVSIHGAAYPLEDAVLYRERTLGTSNEARSDEVEVAVREGALLVLWSDGPSG
ncbi:MAG: thiamine diphosphokinase [Firmicutes bacterium]|nr:thiamine diphosphokinase [Bacillota bacterium]